MHNDKEYTAKESCFKTCVRARHGELFKLLRELNIDRKELRAMINLNWKPDTTARKDRIHQTHSN